MFDFGALYQNYSTEELLRIVQQPTLYQNAAVEAAQKILSERKVSNQEVSEIQSAIAIEQQMAKEPSQTERFHERARQFAVYLLTPSQSFDPVKWIYWLGIAFIVHFVFHVYNTFSYVRYTLLRCDDCSVDTITIVTLITWIYIPLMIAWLLQHKKSGWMLAVFYVTLQSIGVTFALLEGWKYLKHLWLSEGIWIASYIAASILLNKTEVRNIFGASASLWKQVFMVAVILAALVAFVNISKL